MGRIWKNRMVSVHCQFDWISHHTGGIPLSVTLGHFQEN